MACVALTVAELAAIAEDLAPRIVSIGLGGTPIAVESKPANCGFLHVHLT